MEELRTNLGNNVRYLRESHGLNQEQLGEKLKITQVQVNHVENGHRLFSVKRLAQIAELFDVTIDDLLFSDLTKEEQVAA